MREVRVEVKRNYGVYEVLTFSIGDTESDEESLDEYLTNTYDSYSLYIEESND